MRRLVRSIPETPSVSPKGVGGPAEKRLSLWDLPLKCLGLTIGFFGLGHWVGEISVLIASALYFFGLAILFLGFWAWFNTWCNSRLKRLCLRVAAGLVLVAFGCLDFNWIRKDWTPTFLYLTPTHELIGCERRAFFVNHAGLRDIQNVKIIIKDNASGAAVENDDYRTGIEPGPQNPDAPRYIWVKPSHPWDEDYTITVTGTKFRSVQETVLRSTGHDVQFAVRITLDSMKRPVVTCRDSRLPETYSLARGSRENCSTLMAVDPKFLDKLQPEFYGFGNPDGSYTVVRVKELPPASHLDSQSEDRHLTEYEQTLMRSKLFKYRGTKLLLLYAGGPKTLTFATEFRDTLRTLGWLVDGPRPAPVGDERIVDVQITVSQRYWNTPYPRAMDLVSSLEGIKQRQTYAYDEAIPPDLIVLWVGPKSPDNFRPDDCIQPELIPRPGQHHTCEMVVQTTVPCPLIPH